MTFVNYIKQNIGTYVTGILFTAGVANGLQGDCYNYKKISEIEPKIERNYLGVITNFNSLDKTVQENIVIFSSKARKKYDSSFYLIGLSMVAGAYTLSKNQRNDNKKIKENNKEKI